MVQPVAVAFAACLLGAAPDKLLDRLVGGDQDVSAPAHVVADVSDDRLHSRLTTVYGELEGLSQVSVEVRSGVVRLGGELASDAQRDEAVRLAEQTPGVVAVVDRLETPSGVLSRIRPVVEGLKTKGIGLVARLPLFAVAGLIFAAFVALSRLVARRDRLFRRVVRNPFVASLLRQVVGTLMVIAGAIAALEVLDATGIVGAILGAAGIIGLALGFAFKNTAENYIASVLMTVRQPFEPNDLVLIQDHEGRVVRLTSRATILMTLDGNHVRIPNADVFKSTMVNFTRNPMRRFQFDVGVGTTDDLIEATSLAIDTLTQMEGVMDDPAAEAHVLELGDSSVKVRVFGWVDQSAYDFLRVRSEAVRLVKTAFDDAFVSMPEPVYNIRLWDEKKGFKAVPPQAASDAQRSTPSAKGLPNLRPDRFIERQIAEEQAQEQDLLDASAAKE